MPEPSAEPSVLLLGKGGMLFRAWSDHLEERGVSFSAPGLDEFDFCDPDSYLPHLVGAIKTVINCAGYTDVDAAEENCELALQINGTGPGLLAKLCAERKIGLVHYSTDYVFDGSATEPYPTDSPIRPLGVYGRSKAMGEAAIWENHPGALVIRTSWLYAPWGKNFVRTMASLVSSRPQVSVVVDQRGRPTSATHLVNISSQLIDAGQVGFFHVTDGGECTWHEFAVAIAEALKVPCQVEGCNSDAFPRPAPRPGYSVLDLSKTESLVGEMPSWRANLAAVLARISSEN
jgi:dTDP-4-dehydrorhamnose reductase